MLSQDSKFHIYENLQTQINLSPFQILGSASGWVGENLGW